MFAFFDMIPEHARPPITIVDVGAASLGPGTDPYDALLRYAGTRVVGFEPNTDTCRDLNATAGEGRRYLPAFVGDGGRRTFHALENPFTSSLYAPDDAVLDCFQQLSLPLVETREVDTVRLDDVPDLGDVDFLKIDVQGAELDVLRGAGKVLESVVAIHTEVEFIPLYRDQPLYSDIDVFVRGHGFLLHRFVGMFSRQMKPIVRNNDIFASGSQLLYADGAVFVRNFSRIAALPDVKLLKLAGIMHDVYRSTDFVGFLLHEFDRRTGSALLQDYVSRHNAQG